MRNERKKNRVTIKKIFLHFGKKEKRKAEEPRKLSRLTSEKEKKKKTVNSKASLKLIPTI